MRCSPFCISHCTRIEGVEKLRLGRDEPASREGLHLESGRQGQIGGLDRKKPTRMGAVIARSSSPCKSLRLVVVPFFGVERPHGTDGAPGRGKSNVKHHLKFDSLNFVERNLILGSVIDVMQYNSAISLIENSRLSYIAGWTLKLRENRKLKRKVGGIELGKPIPWMGGKQTEQELLFGWIQE
jgi:hypothetical protein